MEDVLLKHKVLLSEDDDPLAQWVREILDSDKFLVHEVRRGNVALDALREHHLALMIPDLLLPNLNDMAVCRRIRKLLSLPALVLTARVDLDAQVAGLQTGANDYRVKPIELRLLIARARARALLCRMHPAPAAVGAPPIGDALKSDKLVISPPNRKVTWRGNILKALRGIEFGALDRSVSSSISPLKRRFADATSAPCKLKTIWDAATYSARLRGRSQCFVR